MENEQHLYQYTSNMDVYRYAPIDVYIIQIGTAVLGLDR